MTHYDSYDLHWNDLDLDMTSTLKWQWPYRYLRAPGLGEPFLLVKVVLDTFFRSQKVLHHIWRLNSDDLDAI